jgi:hypothetical protein
MLSYVAVWQEHQCKKQYDLKGATTNKLNIFSSKLPRHKLAVL